MATRLSGKDIVAGDVAAKDAIVLADIIAARNTLTGKETPLWKRPIAEVQARGLPAKVQVVTVEVTSAAELRRVQDFIDQLKNAD